MGQTIALDNQTIAMDNQTLAAQILQKKVAVKCEMLPVWKVPRVIGKSPRTHWGPLGSPTASHARMAPPPPPPPPPPRSKSLGSDPVYNAVAILASRTRPRARGDHS